MASSLVTALFEKKAGPQAKKSQAKSKVVTAPSLAVQAEVIALWQDVELAPPGHAIAPNFGSVPGATRAELEPASLELTAKFAEKALGALSVVGEGVHTLIVDLEDVPAVDATGLVALESIVNRINRGGAKVVLTGVRPQPRRALERAGFREETGKLEITEDADTTLQRFLNP